MISSSELIDESEMFSFLSVFCLIMYFFGNNGMLVKSDRFMRAIYFFVHNLFKE